MKPKTIEILKAIALNEDNITAERQKAINLLGDLKEEEALAEIALKSRDLKEYTLTILRKMLQMI